jgi:hypothetical protein
MSSRRRSSKRSPKKKTSQLDLTKFENLGVGEVIDVSNILQEPQNRKEKSPTKKNKEIIISVQKKDYDEDKYSSKIKLDHSNNKLEIFKNTLNRQNYRISPNKNKSDIPIFENNKKQSPRQLPQQLPRQSPYQILNKQESQYNYSNLDNYNKNYDRRHSPTYINQNIRKSPDKQVMQRIPDKEMIQQIQINKNNKQSPKLVDSNLIKYRRESPSIINFTTDYNTHYDKLRNLENEGYYKPTIYNRDYLEKPSELINKSVINHTPQLINHDIDLGINTRYREYRESPSLLNNNNKYKIKDNYDNFVKKDDYIDLNSGGMRKSPDKQVMQRIPDYNRNYRESPSLLRYNNIVDNYNNNKMAVDNKKHSPQLRNKKGENNLIIPEQIANIPTIKDFQNKLKTNNEIKSVDKKVQVLTNLDNFELPKKYVKESLFLKNKDQILYFKNLPDITDKYICTIISDGIKINKHQ